MIRTRSLTVEGPGDRESELGSGAPVGGAGGLSSPGAGAGALVGVSVGDEKGEGPSSGAGDGGD